MDNAKVRLAVKASRSQSWNRPVAAKDIAAEKWHIWTRKWRQDATMYFLEHVESRPDVVYSTRDAVRCSNWHPDAGGRGCRRSSRALLNRADAFTLQSSV